LGFEWGARLLAILALVIIISGLAVLALPDTMEGDEMIELDPTHSVHVADLVGALLVGCGILLTWGTVLAWQRRRIER
jgi:hypothetical protein